MGCTCSRLQDVDSEVADIRASRYSVDSIRHPADPPSDALFSHIRPQSSHTATARPAAAARHSHALPRSSSTGGGSSLSRSQWKQMRTLARSNTNPHYHQIQQLQLLASNSQEQQRRQQQQSRSELRTTVAARAAGGQQTATAAVTAAPYLQQYRSHHPHHRIHHYDHSGAQSISQDPRPYDTPANLGSSIASSTGSSITSSSKAPADALLPEQVLALCGAVVEEGPALAAAGIQPLMLASVCLIESGGCPHAKQYRDHVGDVALGICQMLLSTAQWLASSKGFDRYGSNPTAADIEQPKACVYFCAAYLSILAQHDGSLRSESFIVKAYHAGPKGVDSAAAGSYWHKYLKAKHCLKGVVTAMAATVAAAAAAAGLPLAVYTAAAADGAAAGSLGHHSNGRDNSSSNRSMGKLSQESGSGSDIDGSSGNTGSQQQLWVWARAAKLITALSSSWEHGSGDEVAATAGESAGSSSFFTHLLPASLRPSSAPSKGHIQQQQQHEPAAAALLRRWRSGSSAAGNLSSAGSTSTRTCRSSSTSSSTAAAAAAAAASSEGAFALAPVARSALDAALVRLNVIDSTTTYTCLCNAASEANRRLKSRHSLSSSSSILAQAAAAAAERQAAGTAISSSNNNAVLAAMPCVMHVVGHGETLAHIGAICGIAVPDIIAANPDLTDGATVQANDCIALPVPVIPPRLHVVQAGDTIHSIAKAYRVPLGRLVAKNPELTDPTRVQPGWVLVLPGLKGDSKSGLSLEWLAEVAAAEEQQVLTLAGSRAGFSDMGIRRSRRGSSSWQQQDVDGQPRNHGDQDVSAAEGLGSSTGSGLTTGFPAAADAVHHCWGLDDSRAQADVANDRAGSVASPCVAARRSHSADATAAVTPAVVRAAESAASLPSVGSGIFLFTVGQSCSYPPCERLHQQQGKHGSSGSGGSSKTRQRGKHWAVGADAAAAAAAQQLEVAAAAGAAAVVSRG